MKSVEEIIEGQPPFVMVPVELIRSQASDNAILCFCAMGSFGPESRAKVLTIGDRMRKTQKKAVRAAQKELLDLGFIRLKEEATRYKPREWALWPYKVKCSGGVDLSPSTSRGVLNHPPKQISNQTENFNQAQKQDTPLAVLDLEAPRTPPSPFTSKHPLQDAAWTALKAVWTLKHSGVALAWPAKTMRNWQDLFLAEVDRLGVDELARRWSNMVNDPFKKPSLRFFIQETDSWITARAEKGVSSARQYHMPTVTESAPSVRVR